MVTKIVKASGLRRVTDDRARDRWTRTSKPTDRVNIKLQQLEAKLKVLSDIDKDILDKPV